MTTCGHGSARSCRGRRRRASARTGCGTTLTWVERNCGYATARAYAGHADGGDGGTTATYVRAGLPEVAAALAALTGEPHPLARPD